MLHGAHVFFQLACHAPVLGEHNQAAGRVFYGHGGGELFEMALQQADATGVFGYVIGRHQQGAGIVKRCAARVAVELGE